MQPNIPQGPYVRYPSYRLRTPSLIDISLQKLMEHRMQEAQYNAQQQAVASRTPTVLTDPLLNLRVRDYYRQKYEQSLQAEVAGRISGSLEGAAIGAGIASTIMSAALLIAGIVSPIPGDEAIGGTALGGSITALGKAVSMGAEISTAAALTRGAAVVGAGIGATAGTIGADYTTWYATRDMFKNLWQNQSVGRGVLNTMSFVGNSMDLIGSSAVIKSSLYALIKSKDVLETIKETYGLTEAGRTNMDFSMIREELGIELGGVGNFVFDMTGETLADIGNLSGIAKGVTNVATNKEYVKLITDNLKQLFTKTDDVITDKNFIKTIAKYIRENDLDSLKLTLKNKTNLNVDLEQLAKSKILTSDQATKVDEVLNKFMNSINESAKKSTAVQLNDIFEATDFMDDFLTHVMWRVGNPAIFAIAGAKDINKFLKKFVLTDKFLELNQFVFGNSAIANSIRVAALKKDLKRILKGHSNNFIKQMVGDPDGSKTLNNVIRDIFTEDIEISPDEVVKKLNQNKLSNTTILLEKYNIKSLEDLYNNKSKSPELEDLWNSITTKYNNIITDYEKQLSDLQEQINEYHNKLVKLDVTDQNQKQEFQTISDNLKQAYSQYNKLAQSNNYSYAIFISKVCKDPTNYVSSSRQLSTIYQLKNKLKYMGRLSEEDKKLLTKTWKEIIESYLKNEDSVSINILQQLLTDQDITKLINNNIDKNILEELQVLFDPKVKELNETLDKLSKEYETDLYIYLYNKLVKYGENKYNLTYEEFKDVLILKKKLQELDKLKEQKIIEVRKQYNRKYKKLVKKYGKKIDSNDIDQLVSEYPEYFGKTADGLYFKGNWSEDLHDIGNINSPSKRFFESLKVYNKHFFGLTTWLDLQEKSINKSFQKQYEELEKSLSNIDAFNFFTSLDNTKNYTELINFLQKTELSNVKIEDKEILDLETVIKNYNKKIYNYQTVSNALGENNKFTKIYTYTPFETNATKAARNAKEREALLQALSSFDNPDDLAERIVNLKQTLSDYTIDTINKDDLNTFTKILTNMLEPLYAVNAFTGKNSRLLNNLLSKILFTNFAPGFEDTKIYSDLLDKFFESSDKIVNEIKLNKYISKETRIQLLDFIDQLNNLVEFNGKDLSPKIFNKLINYFNDSEIDEITTKLFKKLITSQDSNLDDVTLLNEVLGSKFGWLKGSAEYNLLIEAIADIKSAEQKTILVLDNFFSFQAKLIKQGFDDLIENSKSISKHKLNNKISVQLSIILTNINTLENKIDDSNLSDDIKRLLHQVINDEITLDQIKDIIPENIIKQYIFPVIELKRKFTLYSTLQENIVYTQSVYSAYNNLIYDVSKFNINDLVHQEIENVGKLNFDTIQDYLSPETIKSKIGSRNTNAFFYFRRLDLILNLASHTQPEIYSKYYNLLHKFMDQFSTELFNNPEKLQKYIDDVHKLMDNLSSDSSIASKLDTLGLLKYYDFQTIGSPKPNYKLNLPKDKITDSHKNLEKNINKLLKEITDLKRYDLFKTEIYLDQLKDTIQLIQPDVNTLKNIDKEMYDSLITLGINNSNVANKIIKSMLYEQIDNAFLDIYNRNKSFNSFIHRKKINGKVVPIDKEIIKEGRSFVIFDTETTGPTNNGLYQISAVRYIYDINGTPKESSRINLILNPNSQLANSWTIDDSVDELYAYSNGGIKQGATKATWSKLAQDSNYTRLDSDADLVKQFQNFLLDDDILIAHNSRFDFDQLINTLHGGTYLDKDGKIIQETADEFNSLKDKFNYNILDSALIQNYTMAFGDAKDGTNLGLGIFGGEADVFKKYITADGIKYFFNDTEVSEDYITNFKAQNGRHLIELTYDLVNDTEEFTFDGGPLHIAQNDIDLMSTWLLKGFDNLHKAGISLDELTNSRDFVNKAKNNILDRLLPEYNEVLDELEKEIKKYFDNYSSYDSETKTNISLSVLGQDAVYHRILKNIEIIKNNKNNFNKRYTAFQEILNDLEDDKLNNTKNIIINNDETQNILNDISNLDDQKINLQNKLKFYNKSKDLMKNSSQSFARRRNLQNIKLTQKSLSEVKNKINNLANQYDEFTFSNLLNELDLKLNSQFENINILKHLHNNSEIGYFQYNTAYVSFINNVIFNNNSDVNDLLNLLSSNFDSILDNDLKEYAKYLNDALQRDPDTFHNVIMARDLLTKLKNNSQFYVDVLDGMDPKYYDVFDNLIKKITYNQSQGIDLSNWRNTTDDNILQLIRQLENDIERRSKFQNFDQNTAQQLLYKLLDNSDKLEMPTARNINELYDYINKGFLGINGSLLQEKKLPINIATLLENVNKRINVTFSSMRQELSFIKNENKLARLDTFTLKEFEEMSTFTQEEFEQVMPKNFFDPKFNTGEFNFDNGVYRLRPAVAIANRARYTPSFSKQYKNSQFLRNEMYNVLGDIFKEQDSYQALPFVELKNNRIYNIIDSAAKAFGIDTYNFIHNCYRNNNFLEFDSQKRLYLEFYDWLYNEIQNNPEELFKYLDVEQDSASLNYLNFIQLLNSINENSFTYIKDPQELKDRIKCMIAYNLLSDKSIYNKFDSEKINVIEDMRKTTNIIKHYDIRETYNSSLDLFDDIRSLFTTIDANGNFTYNIEGFKNYLNKHPEYYLAYMDAKGTITRLNTYNNDLLAQILADENSAYSIISKDSFIGLTNKIQPIQIQNPFIRFLHNELLRPLKILSLSNINFVLQNTITAVFQNTISTGSGINIAKTVNNMFKANKDINDYNDLMTQVISSDTTHNFIGNSSRQLDMWLDLLTDSEYLEALNKNGETELAERISKLTDDELALLHELNLFLHSTSAEGEITSLEESNFKEKEILKQAEKARIKLQEKYGDDVVNTISNTKKAYKGNEIDELIKKQQPDIDPISLSEKRDEFLQLQSQVKQNKYQSTPLEELEEVRDDLLKRKAIYEEHGAKLNYYERRELNIIEDVIRDKKSGIASRLTKIHLLRQFLDLNEHLETVFRVSALRGYIEDGMTFDEATSEVIKRHFIYNNKSMAEQYAEFLIPFISYPLRMISLVESMTHDATTMDLLYRFNKYSWGDEDASRSDYLSRRKARGDIPVGNKLLQLSSPFNEGLMNVQNPIYSINNKLNPLLKPIVDSISGAEYNRWNQIPVISNVNNLTQSIQEGNILHNITSDYYRYSSFGNYYLPRVNNRIGGTVYNRMYTKRGYSRLLMNMQPLNVSNLKYRVNNIMKYSGPYRGNNLS